MITCELKAPISLEMLAGVHINGINLLVGLTFWSAKADEDDAEGISDNLSCVEKIEIHDDGMVFIKWRYSHVFQVDFRGQDMFRSDD